MKSPKDMRVIQIDVTNACVFQCSNCTRFCGHHKKPFFMDFETFKRAVDSLEGYVGTIGIMGGEPTLNPEFEQMAEYLAEKKPSLQNECMLLPQRHFMDSIHDLEFTHTFLHPCGDMMRQTVDGPGLWATTLANYKKYYETIQDTMQYQALNDHSNVSFHQPELISRKALGIKDEDWIPMRDACWVQNLWSASVTPKGAFFCEVAASLDMLFDGPGGWDIEPGWWKREPKDFGDQLHWCEKCGLACETFMRNANESVYDVSEDLYEELKKTGNRLIGTDHINVVEIRNGKIVEENSPKRSEHTGSMPYTKSYSERFAEVNTKLNEKEIYGLFCCYADTPISVIADNISKVDGAMIYAEDKVLRDIKDSLTERDNIVFVSSDGVSKGRALYKALISKMLDRYVLMVDGSISLEDGMTELKELVLNPGTMLYSEYKKNEKNGWFSALSDGVVMLVNGAAKSIKKIGWDHILKISSAKELQSLWEQRKVFAFSPDTVYTAPMDTIYPERYVVYGAGNMARAAIDKLISAGATVVGVVDGNRDKWGQLIDDHVIEDPAGILSDHSRYDRVMIGSSVYYREIKKILLEYGIKQENMAWI